MQRWLRADSHRPCNIGSTPAAQDVHCRTGNCWQLSTHLARSSGVKPEPRLQWQDLHPAQSEAQHDPAPAGKLDLYIAAAGFHPRRILPCVIDVGTDNEQLRADPVYMGLNQPRIKGPEYVEVCSSLQQLFVPSPEADDVSALARALLLADMQSPQQQLLGSA